MASPSRGRTQLFCFVFFQLEELFLLRVTQTHGSVRLLLCVACTVSARNELAHGGAAIRSGHNATMLPTFFFFFLFCPTLSFPFLFYFSFSSLIDFSLERRWLLFFCLMMARPRWRACSLFRLTSSLLVFVFFILFVLEL